MAQEKEIILNVEVREQLRKKVTRKMKRIEKIPGVVYGKGFENVNLTIDEKDFLKIRKEESENVIITLKGAGKEDVKVIVHDLDNHPIHERIRHIDFLKIDLKQKVHTHVPIEFVGTSKAVKEMGGVLVKNIDELEVRCLPMEIPDHIEADISVLEDIDNHILVSDLEIDSAVEVLTKEDGVIATVTIKKKEEEVKPVETAEGEEAEGEAEGEAAEGEEKKEDGAAGEK